MQIESQKIHETLNEIAIYCNKNDITDPFVCLQAIRKALIALESNTAILKSQHVYHEILEQYHKNE